MQCKRSVLQKSALLSVLTLPFPSLFHEMILALIADQFSFLPAASVSDHAASLARDDGRLTCVVNGPSRIVNHGLLPYLLLGLGGHSYALFTFLQYLRVRVRYCDVSLCSEFRITD